MELIAELLIFKIMEWSRKHKKASRIVRLGITVKWFLHLYIYRGVDVGVTVVGHDIKHGFWYLV